MPDYQSYPTWQPGADEYNVDPQVLRADLLALIENLIDQGLLIRA